MIQHPSIVVGAIPQGKPAVQELYTFLMSDYLPSRFPSMFSLDQDKRMFRNAVTGKSSPVIPPSDPVEALRILGETVEDDMFLLHETDKGHRNVAYVCCYCSGFDPSKKLDKLLVEIHEPVPSYDKIGPSMERFFSRVEVGKNVKRSNVSYTTMNMTAPMSISSNSTAHMWNGSGRSSTHLSCSTVAATMSMPPTSTTWSVMKTSILARYGCPSLDSPPAIRSF